MPYRRRVGRKKPEAPVGDRKHLEDMLDEALGETFPASDPVALTEPGTDGPLKPKPRRAARLS